MEWDRSSRGAELLSILRVTEMFLAHRIPAVSCRIQLAEMLQLFFKERERERIDKKEE